MPNKPKKIRRGTYAAAEQSERDRLAYNKRQEEMKKQQQEQSQGSDGDEEERSKWAKTAEQRRQRQERQQQEQQAHQESERRQRAEWKEQQREQSRQQQQQQQQSQPRQQQHRMTQRRLQCLRVLGLTAQQDTIAEIKKAYRRLALANHPDHGGNPERMKSINAANDFLAAADDDE